MRELVLREPELRDPERVERARVAAPFFAAALRFVAARLRVAAAFLPACERLLGPVTRVSRSDSTSPRSAIVLRSAAGARLFAALPAVDSCLATLLRSPLLRSLSNSSWSILWFFAMDSVLLFRGRMNLRDPFPVRVLLNRRAERPPPTSPRCARSAIRPEPPST